MLSVGKSVQTSWTTLLGKKSLENLQDIFWYFPLYFVLRSLYRNEPWLFSPCAQLVTYCELKPWILKLETYLLGTWILLSKLGTWNENTGRVYIACVSILDPWHWAGANDDSDSSKYFQVYAACRGKLEWPHLSSWDPAYYITFDTSTLMKQLFSMSPYQMAPTVVWFQILRVKLVVLCFSKF